MNKNEMLNEIYCEQRETNRQLEKLGTVALLGILVYLGKNAEDEESKKLCKLGIGLSIVTNVLIMVSGIVDRRK